MCISIYHVWLNRRGEKCEDRMERKWKWIFWTQCIVRLNLNLSKLSACSFPPVCNLCLSWFRWWWVRGWALVCAGRSARVKHSCWLFMRRSSRPSQVPPHLCSSEPVASCGCFSVTERHKVQPSSTGIQTLLFKSLGQ